MDFHTHPPFWPVALSAKSLTPPTRFVRKSAQTREAFP
jgi:hypothetical protein